MHRLETLFPQFMGALSGLDAAALRAACLSACERAVRDVRPSSPVMVSAMSRLRAGGSLSAVDREALERETQAADDAYLDLQDETEDDASKPAQATVRFSEARLGSALLGAFGATTPERAADSIYEALAAQTDGRAGAMALLLTLT